MADRRVFFALWPDAETAAAIDGSADRLAVDGRRVARERLHLTLAFVGNVNDTVLAQLCQRAASVRVAQFSLVLDGVGYFARPRIVWLGSANVPHELDMLAQALAQSHDLESGAKRFRPHITLARGAQRPDPEARMTPIQWRVREFCLVESGRGGAPGGYTILGRWSLDSPASG